MFWLVERASFTEFVPGQMELLIIYPNYNEEPQRNFGPFFFPFFTHSYPIGEKYEWGPTKLRTLSLLPKRLPFLVGFTSLRRFFFCFA